MELDAVAARAWVDAFAAACAARAAELNELDRQAGDGDFGTSVTSALERARAALEASPPASAADVFAALSAAFLAAGGTSGPLFGMCFRELAAVERDGLAAAVGAALATVQRLGGAGIGDKTMVDALAPAAEALAAGGDVAAAAAAARAGAESTAALVARRGRASYVGEAAVGVVDPGAAAVALFFESAPSIEPEDSP